MHKAILGLGSNLGNRTENLGAASRAIGLLPGTTVLIGSHYYETEPFDVPDEQPFYVNQCLVIMTELSPHALLGACLGVEAAMGRHRKVEHSARIIDIDLLLYEGVVNTDAELMLPHPGILKRAFVMVPLAELFPDKKALGLNFSASFAKTDCTGVKPF